MRGGVEAGEEGPVIRESEGREGRAHVFRSLSKWMIVSVTRLCCAFETIGGTDDASPGDVEQVRRQAFLEIVRPGREGIRSCQRDLTQTS